MAEASDTITIQGHDFPVADRYEEGHTITANEAAALNQTFFENLRNNFAGKVRAAKEEHAKATGHTGNINEVVLPEDRLAALHSEFEQYAKDYEFGVRRAGTGVSADPVEAAAMQLARQAIRDMVRTKGTKKLKDYTAEEIEFAANVFLNGKDGQPGRGAYLRDVARTKLDERKQNAAAALEALQGAGNVAQAA